jgi:hypothetical protein
MHDSEGKSVMSIRRKDKWKLEFDDHQTAYMVELLAYAIKMHDDLIKGSNDLGAFSKFSHKVSKATAEQLHAYITQITG